MPGIDDGWQACGSGFNGSFHDAAGKPLINLTRFPDMRAMNIEAHGKGVKMGWWVSGAVYALVLHTRDARGAAPLGDFPEHG